MFEKILVLGCDGYIGNALVQRLLTLGYSVVGVDNFMRRNWIDSDMHSKSAIKILSMEDKLTRFQKMGPFKFHMCDVAESPPLISEIIKVEKPDIIINLAHIPSGPYSQISRDHANKTMMNNYIGTNNVLWALREHVPNAHYITIGTTGEYDHYSNIDIEEGYIRINHNGRESNEMIYPRRPGSIYHCSKTASTYLIDFLARAWKIKCTDVQQSIVFGAYTDEISKTGIYSRFDSDEAGGTVLNRFIVQAVLGIPLTVYGEGKHQRGFLSLNDSVQALTLAVKNPAQPGKVQVWNQLSEWHSMNDIAQMVIDVVGNTVKVQHIATPRNEHTGEHYYKYKIEKLAKLGYKPTRTIKEEIKYVYNMLKPQFRELQSLRDVVQPKIKWS
jgi:nucleoside-diphosphate-sugar epimerase